MKKKILMMLVIVILVVGSCSIQKRSSNNDVEEKIESENNPIVTFEMEDGKEIIAELYPGIAPNTVNNFISLIEDGFYDGLIFHRVIKGFMIQGGCPEGTGLGSSDYGQIKGEFESNGFSNSLSHTAGVLSMARAQDKNSASSQFFIIHKASSHLDGQYAAFGKVTEGMDVVDEIGNVKTGQGDKPIEDQVIKSITVDLNGYDYIEPVRIK
jgi:peptidyl-prolyl cis-trans isomerase B (cyclophilin B)